MEIVSHGRTRAEISRDIREKEKKREYIALRYQNSKLSSDEIRWCLYSISDNHSFLSSNCDPVDYMIRSLKLYFSLDEVKSDDQLSLAIYGGEDGSRLSHSHTKQYQYVLQSLCLWREITFDMFRLWVLSESDLLDPKNPYTLTGTLWISQFPFLLFVFFLSLTFLSCVCLIWDQTQGRACIESNNHRTHSGRLRRF
jgi:hypothetical protein